jgi:microcompartment protein CcmK/EutM
MQLARVIGNAIATQKTGLKDGLKLLLIQYLDVDLNPMEKTAVCVDTVNARHGDLILACSSSSARMTSRTKGLCTDTAIVGIVDIISQKGADLYNKDMH